MCFGQGGSFPPASFSLLPPMPTSDIFSKCTTKQAAVLLALICTDLL